MKLWVQGAAILLLLVGGSIAGCGKSFKGDADSASGRIKVQIIAPGSVTNDTAATTPYSFAVVDLLDVYDLVSSSGKYAQFYTRASRVEGHLLGTQPRGQFLKSKEGTFVPKNFLTQQIATLYYHAQNLVRLETSLDFDSKRNKPLKIVLDTPVLNTKQNENNAFFDGDLDAIVFLKYSEGNLPLSLNGGVFAHEYFHSIFDKLVIRAVKNSDVFSIPIAINKLINSKTLDDVKNKDLSEQVKKLTVKLAEGPVTLDADNVKWYYSLLIKGFNEGLADYWGWQYVNDSAFIAHSLPQTITTRKLDLKSQNIETLQLLSEAEMLSIVYQVSESDEEKLDLVNAYSYLLGARVALFFKTYSETVQRERGLSDTEVKKNMNQTVINFVKSLAKSLPQITMASAQTELKSPYALMYDFITAQEIKNQNECNLLRLFLENDPNWSNKLECVASGQSSSSQFKLATKGVQ
tara:strand:- start:33197 stop:34588 length:1392 start_codon:yes stop_codon:yes gene_type:complete